MSASESGSSSVPPRAPGRPAWLGWGWLLLLQFAVILSAWWAGGLFDYRALIILTVVFAGCVGFLGLARPRAGTWWLVLPTGAVLAAVLVHDLLTREALLYAEKPQRLAFLVLAGASLALLIVGWLVRRRWLRIGLSIGAVLLFGAFLVSQLHRSPSPLIDTWQTNSEATEAFLKGLNPYDREYTNIYEQRGSDIKVDYPMLFNYLPGLILHYVPGTVLGGDIRWTNLAGMTCGLLVFALCVRPRSGGPSRAPHPVTRAAAVVLFWYHGGQMLVLEQAWPEAWLLVYIALAMWTWRRSRWVPAAALILALTLKQTAWFCAPFFVALSLREGRWRLIAAVAAGVAAVVLPFFLWNPRAFTHNVVLHFLKLGARPQALSWTAACLRAAPHLVPLVSWLSYAVYAAAFGCLVVRIRRCRGHAAVMETYTWMTLGLFGLFLFLKQSFFNYYYVVGGLLAFYPCLAARDGGDRAA